MASSYIVGQTAAGLTQTIRSFGTGATGDLGVQTNSSAATGSSVPSIATFGAMNVGGTLTGLTGTGTSLNVFQPVMSVVDPGNSSTNPLGINGTFTGQWVDTLGYASIAYSIQSDVVSSTGGIERQWSQDGGTTWFYWDHDTLDVDRIGANNGTDLVVRCHARYFRLIYTNGPYAQTFFRLQTILNKYMPSGDTVGVSHAPSSGNDALLVKAILTGKSVTGGGTYVDVEVNPSGALVFAGDITPSDAFANPTNANNEVSFLMGWNGTTWDRLKSSMSNGLQVDVTRLAQIPASLGQKTSVNSLAVVVASDQSLIPTKLLSGTGAAPTITTVPSSITSQTFAVANANRLGLTVYNDSTQPLYLKLGATAGTSSYTIRMQPKSYYEVPYGYVGRVDGVWLAADGNALVTELT